ncbi:hypothetical protein GCM10025867_47490 (plasmid) [Frondihabitans sucicola]|uniref:Uncharacterized protein n=1 Tax=Frondihabitans sucicola TaxID=1268041 RepID=A0ABM8GVL5_9MICO|nr:hypothetical protein [Frondihabitans sucicola]BDZ52508.1 hypothetical protein GCM10025867_47490 [Frondihabitans sucicola]
MCRTSLRHCRDSWSEEQKALENAKRRVTRNAAKREASDSDEARAKYDALAAKARAETETLQATIDARKAEHFDQRAKGEAEEASGEAPQVTADATGDEAPTESLTQPLPTTAPDAATPPERTRAPKKAPGGSRKSPSTARRSSSRGSSGSGGGRSSDPNAKTTLLGTFLTWFIEGRRQESMHRSLERAGIPHSFQEGFLHVAQSDWNENTYNALRAHGIKELPVKWGDDWSMPLGTYKGLVATEGAA